MNDPDILALRSHLATSHSVSTGHMLATFPHGPDHDLTADELGALHVQIHVVEATTASDGAPGPQGVTGPQGGQGATGEKCLTGECEHPEHHGT